MTETFMIPIEAAEAYEARFVPAIFAEWAPRVLDAAAVGPGSRVLDVACGTGIVARTALEQVGTDGAVVGVDVNEAMLTVARRVGPDIEWRRGNVTALPVDDDDFDAVTCQMALMFFPDRVAAFAEMARAVRPAGRVAVVVPAALDAQPAYRPFVEIAVSHTGPEARSLLGTYWNCGDVDELVVHAAAGGLEAVDRSTTVGIAHFPTALGFVDTEIQGSPLAERVDDATARRIGADVAERLAGYAEPGSFDVPLVCHVLAFTRGG